MQDKSKKRIITKWNSLGYFNEGIFLESFDLVFKKVPDDV
jgi:hypothetical protein